MKCLDLSVLFEPNAASTPLDDIAANRSQQAFNADHSSVPETGSLKTASSVLRCLTYISLLALFAGTSLRRYGLQVGGDGFEVAFRQVSHVLLDFDHGATGGIIVRGEAGFEIIDDIALAPGADRA